MNTLVIETSTERGIVAILKNSHLLFEKELPFGYNNSSYLMPIINDALSNTGMLITDIGLIAVGVGPGSYTGIRVGAIVAKTLALSLKIPIIGISSLEGFLFNSDGPFAALIDAKIGGVYFCTGIKNGETITYDHFSDICELNHIIDKLSTIKNIVTPFAAQLKQKIDNIFPDNHLIWQENAPSSQRFAQLAQIKYKSKEYDPSSKLELLYLRKTQAEIEKELKKPRNEIN